VAVVVERAVELPLGKTEDQEAEQDPIQVLRAAQETREVFLHQKEIMEEPQLILVDQEAEEERLPLEPQEQPQPMVEMVAQERPPQLLDHPLPEQGAVVVEIIQRVVEHGGLVGQVVVEMVQRLVFLQPLEEPIRVAAEEVAPELKHLTASQAALA
jgi:hypothetical protein